MLKIKELLVISVEKLSEMVTCDVCHKSVKKMRFNHHSHTHFDKFSCHYCSKVSNRKINLQEHKRIQNGKKPFACDICGKGFHQKIKVVFTTDSMKNCRFNRNNCKSSCQSIAKFSGFLDDSIQVTI